MNLTQLKEIKEIVDCLIEFSQSSIIQSNFVEAFYKYSIAHEHGHTLYGNIKLFGAKSFRITSNHPNLNNFPATGSIYAKPVKACFKVEEGKVFYIVDLSALEDRVIANLSRDANKCSIFLEGIDGHCLNSKVYFEEEVEAELPPLPNETSTEYIKRYYSEIEKGNKVLKAIRQKSKPCTFLLAYGGYPEKLAKNAKLSLSKAQEIFNNYHEKLYLGITEMRDKTLEQAISNGKIHMGLGCYMNTYDPEKEIRTLFNALSQFWSILTLLTINKMHTLIDEKGYTEDVKIVSTIYDSIYIVVTEDASIIEWVNNTIIPILTADFLTDTIVHNEAEGELGYNWCDTIKIPNNSSIEEIETILKSLKEQSHE